MPDILIATATSSGTGGTVTATVNGVDTTVHVIRDLVVTIGDRLVITKTQQVWWAVGLAYDAPPAAGGGGDVPPTGGSSGTLVVAPVETRTYRGGKWRTDTSSVYQGDWSGTGNNTGCVFYGSGPRSLAGATVSSASIQVRRMEAGFYAAFTTKIWLMTQAIRPSGAPTLGSSAAGPSIAVGATKSFTLPAGWAAALIAGTAGGLAFQDTATQGHYARLAGLGDWASAFTLSISWSR